MGTKINRRRAARLGLEAAVFLAGAGVILWLATSMGACSDVGTFRVEDVGAYEQARLDFKSAAASLEQLGQSIGSETISKIGAAGGNLAAASEGVIDPDGLVDPARAGEAAGSVGSALLGPVGGGAAAVVGTALAAYFRRRQVSTMEALEQTVRGLQAAGGVTEEQKRELKKTQGAATEKLVDGLR